MPKDKKKIQDILNRFSRATIKAAMADRPEIMQASGWDYDKDGNLVQGDPNAEGPKRLASSLAEISTIPLTDFGGELLLNIPSVQRGLSAAGTLLKRYGPTGRRLTKNVKAAIGAVPDILPGQEAADVNGALRDYLIKEGVRPGILTDDALEKLSRGRMLAIENAVNVAPGRFVMSAAPYLDGFQEYVIMQPGYPQVRPNYPQGTIGYINAAPEPLLNNEYLVGMVKNFTENTDDVQRGISRIGYDALIKDKGSVVSGAHLMHPEKTTHIWEKYYPEKEFVGNFGRQGADWRTAVENTPVYRLTKPSQDVLIKNADIFSAESLSPDGRFIVDFAKDAYRGNGGFLQNPYAGGGGLSRSKDYKSSKKPYPSVKSGDFAGGGRSYPIPTKADAVDALRLAGLHHRPDVKAKVYAKYPSLKHADGGPLDSGIDYSGIETTNNRKYNQDYISYIDNALANAQLPDAKRASILANIIEESGGDPFALDSTGKFYGLLQWADDRYSPTGELDPYREIDNQVANIINTLGNTTDGKSWTHGGTGSGYNSYKDAMADFDDEDLATAMKGFTLGYVRPTGKIDSYNNRLKVAQQILDKYNNVPAKKAATLIEKMKAAFGNDTEAMQRLINVAKVSSGGFR